MDRYHFFQTTAQPGRKLETAIAGYVELTESGKQGQEWSDYGAYLKLRRRPALELLVREENLEGLRIFRKNGWLTTEDLPRLFQLAEGRRESQLWLLQLEKGADPSVSVNKSSREIGLEIRRILEGRLRDRIPSLDGAFPCLEWQEGEVWGTDGHHLFYEREELQRTFVEDTEGLCRRYLHSLCHCLYLHMLLMDQKAADPGGQERRLLDLACDLAVEWELDLCGWYAYPYERRQKRNHWYGQILEASGRRDTKSCRQWLENLRLEEQTLQELEAEFGMDDHSCWKKKTVSHRLELEDQEGLAGTWGRARQGISMEQSGAGMKGGTRGGTAEEFYNPQKKKTYDYKKFLWQFCVSREEMELNPEDFDYIPYDYGLRRYGNVVFLEPLETTEVTRLEEFVIAIDTSGSCSGEIVRRFLDETWSILGNQEHFFRKMNVHIIQCDSMIQDHKKITCREEWEAYQKEVKIRGLGGTDFTPVFRLVDELIAKKEIRRLKGLLYFTDGDGIYPREKPAYETAFVFLNQALEKKQIPDWAIRLNLQMKVEKT